jgi:DNA-binding transcriptional LysR family regulator
MSSVAPLDVPPASPRSRAASSRVIKAPAWRRKPDESAGSDDGARPAPTPPTKTQWQAIEVRHLVALAAVAHEGSFRRAAEDLDYVQSAISGQIAHLEQAAGTRLLDRASGTPIVKLTDAGHVLMRHTEEILARFEAAYDDLRSLATRAAGTVRVAGLERLAPRRQAELLSLFRASVPLARLVLEEPVSETLALQLLAAGTIDLLVSEVPLVPEEFIHFVLEEDLYVLLVAAESPLAHTRDAISAAELESLRPIIPGGCISRNEVETIIRALGLRGRSPLKPGSVATAQALVGAGVGEAIVPRRLIDATDPKTVTVELPDVFPSHATVLGLDSGRNHSLAVRGFVDAVRRVFEVERLSETQGASAGIKLRAESASSSLVTLASSTQHAA